MSLMYKRFQRPSLIQLSRRRFCVSEKFPVDFSGKHFEFGDETKIYGWWEKKGLFAPSPDTSRQCFTILMPPPNVTGNLHMGHALGIAIQDALIRYHRMRGKSVLWLPGTDHAGIATQLQVENKLKAQGESRQLLGREKFEAEVWRWKDEKGGYITSQMRRLGASADWSREQFTLSPAFSSAVTEAFVQLYERGLLYRGDYLVNWSPNLKTAISDLEVEYSEEEGSMYYVKYLLADSTTEYLTVATSRPETMFGDVALCVHPDDDRYVRFIGKEVRIPLCHRTIKVIADNAVDPGLGSGVVKVTPAHDPKDYDIGKRHDLKSIIVFDKDACLNEAAGIYAGLDRFEARAVVWRDMEHRGLAVKTEKYVQRVPRSQRGGEIVEPMLSSQWFVRTKGMAERAVEAVRSGNMLIVPSRFDNVWYEWLENIRDWCVSRQLWWGHRIPAYYVNGSREHFVVARTHEAALRLAKEKYGDDAVVQQDEDVLDTWFSSGLWPMATLGWPCQENMKVDMARFFPSSVLETGYDILFFWVARMVMLSLEFTGSIPFDKVYLHGLVRDEFGKKMSKSKGNVIDPIDLVDKFGSDALRFSLLTASTSIGHDIPLSLEAVETNRNFVNKLWNVGKFVTSMGAKSDAVTVRDLNLDALPLFEKYIVSRCHQVMAEASSYLEGMKLAEAGRLIHSFVWDELADWYVEASKVKLRSDSLRPATADVLLYVWDNSLRMLHPFVPYISEVLWQAIPHDKDSIMLADWSVTAEATSCIDLDAIAHFEILKSVVKGIRATKSEFGTTAGKKIGACIVIPDDRIRVSIQSEVAAIIWMGRLEATRVEIVGIESERSDIFQDSVTFSTEQGVQVFMPKEDVQNKALELDRLTKQQTQVQGVIDDLTKRLANPHFLQKAPENVVDSVRQELALHLSQLSSLVSKISSLN